MVETIRKQAFDRVALLLKDRVRIDEAAFLLCCHPDTVRRWIESGKLEYKRTPGGERRIFTSSIRPYL